MKTTAKTPKKNSSHLPKRAPLDVVRWAIVDELGEFVQAHKTQQGAKDSKFAEERVIKVRITEVAK